MVESSDRAYKPRPYRKRLTTLAQLELEARENPSDFVDSVIGLSRDKKALLLERDDLRQERDFYVRLLATLVEVDGQFEVAVDQDDDAIAEAALDWQSALLESLRLDVLVGNG